MVGKPENVKCPNCLGEMKAVKSKHGWYWKCKKFSCEGTRDSMGMSREDKQANEEEDETERIHRWDRE